MSAVGDVRLPGINGKPLARRAGEGSRRGGEGLPLLPPLLIVLLAWLVRCWHLGFYDFRGDEVFGITYVAAPLGQVIGTLAKGEPHPPFYYLLLREWLPLAGNGEFAVRLFAAAADTLAVALLYVVGRRLAGPTVALGAALLMTFAPYHVWNAQDARMYALATAWVIAAAYATWRIVVAARPDWRGAALYAVAMLLGLYTHYYTIYVAVLLNVFAAVALGGPLLRALTGHAAATPASQALGIVAAGPRPQTSTSPLLPELGDAYWRRVKLWVAAQVAVVALYTPWVIFAWQTLTTYHGSLWSPSLGDAIRDCISTFALGWDMPVSIAYRLVPLYVAVLLLGAVAALRVRRGPLALWLLALWLIVPIGAVWLASRSRPIFDVRYLLEASPPFYLLLALPLAWLPIGRRSKAVAAASPAPSTLAAEGSFGAGATRHEAGRGTRAAPASNRTRAARLGVGLRATLGGVAFLAALIPLFPALSDLYFHPTDGRGHAYSALARYMAAHVGPGDLVVINHLDPVVRFYLARGGVTTPSVTEPPARGVDAAQLNADLSAAVAGKAHIWLLPDDIGAWDKAHTVTNWLKRHTHYLGQATGGFHVLEFQPLTAQATTQVDFGPAMRLAGYRLDPAQPPPGQGWRVTLFWQARAPIPTSETVSVQFLDASGKLVAQADAVPQAGAAPTTTWQTYETIPDPHTLHLPALPPGRYTLGVAVYPSGGGPRLPVAGVPSGLAPIASVSVP